MRLNTFAFLAADATLAAGDELVADLSLKNWNKVNGRRGLVEVTDFLLFGVFGASFLSWEELGALAEAADSTPSLATCLAFVAVLGPLGLPLSRRTFLAEDDATLLLLAVAFTSGKVESGSAASEVLTLLLDNGFFVRLMRLLSLPFPCRAGWDAVAGDATRFFLDSPAPGGCCSLVSSAGAGG